jgi:hypothetical protein
LRESNSAFPRGKTVFPIFPNHVVVWVFGGEEFKKNNNRIQQGCQH